jgi:hypothetical protein
MSGLEESEYHLANSEVTSSRPGQPLIEENRLAPRDAHATAALTEDETAFLRTGLRTLGAVPTLPHYDCPLCHEKLPVGSDAMEIVICSNAFHRTCLLDWLHSDNVWHSCCPVCRAYLFPRRHAGTSAHTHDCPAPEGFATPRSVLTGNRDPSHSDFVNALADRLNSLDIPDEQDEEAQTGGGSKSDGKQQRKEQRDSPAHIDSPDVVIVRSPRNTAGATRVGGATQAAGANQAAGADRQPSRKWRFQ